MTISLHLWSLRLLLCLNSQTTFSSTKTVLGHWLTHTLTDCGNPIDPFSTLSVCLSVSLSRVKQRRTQVLRPERTQGRQRREPQVIYRTGEKVWDYFEKVFDRSHSKIINFILSFDHTPVPFWTWSPFFLLSFDHNPSRLFLRNSVVT